MKGKCYINQIYIYWPSKIRFHGGTTVELFDDVNVIHSVFNRTNVSANIVRKCLPALFLLRQSTTFQHVVEKRKNPLAC